MLAQTGYRIMDDLQRLMAERACEKVIHRFAQALDAYDFEGVLQCWTEDGVLQAPGEDFSGYPGLRRWLEQREKDLICRHVMTNVQVNVLDAELAEAHSICATWRVRGWRGREPGPITTPAFLVDFHDSFRRGATGEWRLALRRSRISLANVEQRQFMRVG